MALGQDVATLIGLLRFTRWGRRPSSYGCYFSAWGHKGGTCVGRLKRPTAFLINQVAVAYTIMAGRSVRLASGGTLVGPWPLSGRRATKFVKRGHDADKGPSEDR